MSTRPPFSCLWSSSGARNNDPSQPALFPRLSLYAPQSWKAARIAPRAESGMLASFYYSRSVRSKIIPRSLHCPFSVNMGVSSFEIFFQIGGHWPLSPLGGLSPGFLCVSAVPPIIGSAPMIPSGEAADAASGGEATLSGEGAAGEGAVIAAGS
jgi:hypothetical protein